MRLQGEIDRVEKWGRAVIGNNWMELAEEGQEGNAARKETSDATEELDRSMVFARPKTMTPRRQRGLEASLENTERQRKRAELLRELLQSKKKELNKLGYKHDHASNVPTRGSDHETGKNRGQKKAVDGRPPKEPINKRTNENVSKAKRFIEKGLEHESTLEKVKKSGRSDVAPSVPEMERKAQGAP